MNGTKRNRTTRRPRKSLLLFMALLLTALGASALAVGNITASTASAEQADSGRSGPDTARNAADPGPDKAGELIVENRTSLGNGHVETVYSRKPDGSPKVIGVAVSEAAADSLPTTPRHDGNTCFDKNDDGKVDPNTECGGGHERVLWFPKLKGLPFKWMMFNWQSVGHGPEHVFDKPHFDVHYFMMDYEARNAIRTGLCGAIFVNCADNEKAAKPVPAPYHPEGFGLPGAAGRMGNHIVDLSAAPANGGPFTQAFVYGTYDSHITFWENVLSTDWLKSTKPKRSCLTLKWAPEVEISGSYPKKSCTSYRAKEKDYLMTFEDFAYRKAPAGAKAPNWTQPPASAGTPAAGSGHGH
ncbi:hypothetical protein [Streptomyces syringium]|uniref:hypothetical protein n=1 Tax=Streptomyces syringium TaxID=76729 RepID=UPI0034462FD1